jgi:hypothetical protein
MKRQLPRELNRDHHFHFSKHVFTQSLPIADTPELILIADLGYLRPGTVDRGASLQGPLPSIKWVVRYVQYLHSVRGVSVEKGYADEECQIR